MRIFLTALFSLTLVCSVQANDDQDFESLLNTSLETLMTFQVVTPTRTNVSRKDAPGSVTVIAQDQIRQSGAQTLPELLRLVPGVNVRWNPMVQTIDIRGFGSSPFTSRVLLLIDGVPYNSWNKGGFPQHPGLDFFNIDYVKHIEIVRGPGSALYGENALNGVVNIVTLSGDDEGVDRVKAGYGSRNTRTYAASKGFEWGKNKLLIGARDFSSEIPVGLWQEYSDGGVTGMDLFTKYNRGNLELTYYRLENDVDGYTEPLNGFPPGSVFRSADSIKQTVNIVGGSYKHESEDGKWQAEVRASHANRDGSHCAACHAPGQSSAFLESTDHGFQNYVESHFNYKLNDTHELLAGFEWREVDTGDHDEELHGSSHTTSSGSEAVSNYTKYAIFLQDQISLLDDKLSVVAGVRYDSATSPSLFGSEFFPRLDMVYQLSKNWTLRGQWGKAARYPSFSELYLDSWFIAAETPNFPIVLAEFEPNFELGPETLETFSVGAEYMHKGLRVKLEAYTNSIEDFIVIAYPRFRFENHPQDARVSGFEVDWEWQPSQQIGLFGNYALQRNSRSGNGLDSSGNQIEFSYAPRHKVNVGVNYKPSEALTVTLTTSWKDEFMAPAFWYPIALGTGPEPLNDYALTNLRVDWQLPWESRGRRPFRLSLFANNIGNATPSETLVGVDSDITGRDYLLQLQYQFSK